MELEISWEEKSLSAQEQQDLMKLLREGIAEALKQADGSEDAEISLVMVDDETIHLLNKSYRGVDRPTDVLSFAMQESGEGEPEIYLGDLFADAQESTEDNPDKTADFSVEAIMEEELSDDEDEEDDEMLVRSEDDDYFIYEDPVLGDIVISVERARVQAQEFGHSLAREIVYLAVHGTLHLLGYDHCSDQDSFVMRRMEERVMGKIGLPR